MINNSASYLPLIAHLRQVLTHAHKKAYTISVGKLNPAKLANFPEIECFVLVACPENSLVDSKVFLNILSNRSTSQDNQEFFRPIVTPFELQLALQPSRTWTGEYVLDFDEVLTRGAPKPSSSEDDDADSPVFSLVTGKYRHAKRYGGERLSRPRPQFYLEGCMPQRMILRPRRCRHPRPSLSEIRMAPSQFSRIVLLVCLALCSRSTRLKPFFQRRVLTITHVPGPRNARRTRFP